MPEKFDAIIVGTGQSGPSLAARMTATARHVGGARARDQGFCWDATDSTTETEMPRIAPLDPTAAEGKSRRLLDGLTKSIGFAPNLMKTLAVAPAALDAYLGFGKALSGARLSAQVRERIAIAVSVANGCEYCTAAHTAIGRSVGLDNDELGRALDGQSDDAGVRAALRFALAITAKRGWVDDADLAAVRAAGFDDGAIAEIVATVAHATFSNYFNHVAGTEVDFPLVPIGRAEAA